jgi:hypothetical protein
MSLNNEKIPVGPEKIPFDLKPPTPEQISERIKFNESKLYRTLFPYEVIDKYGSVAQVSRLIADGNTVLFFMGPHPSTGDPLRALNIGFLDENIVKSLNLNPVAVHMLQSRLEGKFIKQKSEEWGLLIRELVTQRTKERYPGVYSDAQAQDYYLTYMKDMMKLVRLASELKCGLFVSIYDQGDRATDLATSPPSGIYQLVHRFAKKEGLIDQIYLWPGYLRNLGAKPTDDLHELDVFVKYQIYPGKVVSLRSAYEASLVPDTDREGKPIMVSKLDDWGHNLICNIANDVKDPRSYPFERVLYQANKKIYPVVEKVLRIKKSWKKK